MEQRLALPQRSPTPLMVPCTWLHPSSTAARELATASSESLWAWMPRAALGNCFCTALTISISSEVRVPPLVSHSTRYLGPALQGRCPGSSRRSPGCP